MPAQQITLKTMMPEHLDGAVELSRQVRWPHRREDWALVQSLSHGIVALEDGRVLATILMTPYGDDAATINMVLVDASMRGRGLGRQLMEEALAKAGARTCYLVATPEGLPLYQKLGFVVNGEIVQHQGEASPADAPAHVSWSEKGDHACLVALDRAAYGHDRSALMRLLQECAKFAVIRDESSLQTFAAIRAFGRGLAVGPVVARNDSEARALIQFLLAHQPGTFVRIDTDTRANLGEWLTGRGLAHVGGGITMRRATSTTQDDNRTAHHRTYALVNQALG